MKLTKSKLKQIIKEEFAAVVETKQLERGPTFDIQDAIQMLETEEDTTGTLHHVINRLYAALDKLGGGDGEEELEEVKKKTDGLSVLLVDLKKAIGNGMTVRPIRAMINHATTEVFIDDLRIPVEQRIGEEGKGFRYILDGMNAERILIGAECIGDSRWFIQKASEFAKDRTVFQRPIGQNQGIQFPIAKAYAQSEAADLMVRKAAMLFDSGKPCGKEANMAKLLAADASWEAADVCLQTHGGFGFAEEYDIERKFRETRLYRIAPVSTNLILSYLAEHVLGLPRSF